ncbi:hypothetical protein PR048_001280 [Dryococelus australis]|uniref:Uncharacterized protein n=1 Tax=Dryococelus australis TaxID=614101 RepID=A0ABQ9IGW6_9NEOP|nr:hypothetical protein PR048_001280 [Dryococelus australis]
MVLQPLQGVTQLAVYHGLGVAIGQAEQSIVWLKVCACLKLSRAMWATVAERLVCSPKPIRVQSSAGSLRIFACGNRAGRCRWSRRSPVSPALSFRGCSILTSITHVGSQDLDVKRRQNLFTHSLSTFEINVRKMSLPLPEYI